MFSSLCGHLCNILYRKKDDNLYFREACFHVTESSLTTKSGDNIQYDGVLCLSIYNSHGDGGNVHYPKTIAIEVKTTARDIKESSIDKYLGSTHYFFLTSPRGLLPYIIMRYRYHPGRRYIGLIDADDGNIVIMPQEQSFDRGRLHNVLAHCYLSVHRYSMYNDTEPFQKARVSLFPEMIEFVNINGLQVNQEYKDYFV